jgi:fructose-1-phosphate kinase PfkB-like protein
MIVTVTLNPALDKTYSVADFALAGVFRVSKVQHLPSGKGLNVSRVLHTLGVPTMASGFLGGFTGKHIAQELDRLGIKHDFVWSNCESRQCIIVLNEEKGIHTELLEPGPFLAEEMFSLMNMISCYHSGEQGTKIVKKPGWDDRFRKMLAENLVLSLLRGVQNGVRAPRPCIS